MSRGAVGAATAAAALALALVFAAPAPAAAPAAAVALNHFYLVVDSETYAALATNPYLRKTFAPSEERTTARRDITYTGLYFYGEHTYFEVFDAAKWTGGPVGSAGVAFGVDEPGALAELSKREGPWLALGPEPVTRPYRDRQIAWFRSATAPSLPRDDDELSVWLMEYEPTFLAEWNPTGTARDRGVARADVLARYAAVLADAPPSPVLRDVVGLTLAVKPGTRDRLAALCRSFGFEVSQDRGATVLAGPDVRIRLVFATAEARGVREVVMRVRKSEPATFRAGALSVSVDGETATWSF